MNAILAVFLSVCAPLAGSVRAAHMEDDWEGFSSQYVEALVSLLANLETARPHFQFVKKEKIDLKVVLPGLAMPESTLGLYSDRESSMYLNRAMLLEGVREMRLKGSPARDIPRVLAWKTVHIVVHEIRHGMNARRLSAEGGFRFPVTYLEDEYISFMDQMATIHEVLRKRPELWTVGSILEIEKNVAVLVSSQRTSVEGLKKLVRNQERYQAKPSVLELTRAALLADVSRRERHFEVLLKKHEREIMKKYTDPVERKQRLRIAVERYGPTLEDLKTGRMVLEDPAKHALFRSFVSRELDRATRALAVRRSQ